jgi:hypothetical protein
MNGTTASMIAMPKTELFLGAAASGIGRVFVIFAGR